MKLNQNKTCKGKKRSILMTDEDLYIFAEIKCLIGLLECSMDKDRTIIDYIKFDKSISGDDKYKEMNELLKKMEGDIFSGKT